MTAATTADLVDLEGRGRMSSLRALGRKDWLGGLAIAVLVALAVISVFGSTFAPDANVQALPDRLTPPAWDQEGGWDHPLGTDALGRDVFQRLIVGARVTLMIGFLGAGIEVLIGALLGLVAGYRGGIIESFIMRWTDIQMGFPTLLVILLMLLTFGSNTRVLILALGLNGWMIFARLMRAEVRRIRDEPYVQAAKVAGMGATKVVRRHIFPHVRSRLVAVYLLEVPRVILSAAGLSFLGLGVSADDLTWGLMIGDARSIIAVAYWPSLFAGLAIVVSVASLYIFASWLEPHLDPMRKRAAQASRPAPATRPPAVHPGATP